MRTSEERMTRLEAGIEASYERMTQLEREYRGMVQAVSVMADTHREFMQRTTDRLDRIEKIVESNAKSIQALPG